MAKIKLQLTRTPRVPVFASMITPDSFANKTLEEIKKLTVSEGNIKKSLDQLFNINVEGKTSEPVEKTELTISGDLSKFRYVGQGMTEGKITIEGNGGFYLGQQMKGGMIVVHGNVDGWVGSMMTGGSIEVFGDAGEYVAAPYRGDRKGMSNGRIHIHGSVANEAGLWMKRGSIIIGGDAGYFLGFNMQGGTILVGGNCLGRVGPGMRDGRVVIMGELSDVLPNFNFTETRRKVKLEKEKVTGPFYVYTGDILEGGDGKIFVFKCKNHHLNPEDEIFPEKLSVNRLALPFVEKIIGEAERLGVKVEKHQTGATIIDAGVNVNGSEEVGILVALTCLAGLSKFNVENERYGELELPTLHQTTTGHPSAAMLGAQFAGWALRTEDYSAIGSGPARALSQQPKKLYERLCYKDDADVAVLMLEADALPSDSAVKYVADECKVNPKKLYILVASTSSVVGSVQAAARIVETGIHKLTELGFNSNKILSGRGKAPIAPVHLESEVAMGMVNDMILYGGEVHLEVSCKTDDEIVNIIDEVPSMASKDYGKPFYNIFTSVGKDFYKVDPGLFAPAKISVHNVKTGNTYTAGKVNPEVLRQSLELLKKV